ncbi:orotidine-5'-phosphate decarboxylase [Mangrovihabitans endophyticus]|uniref:Orotidine 5'-phosphate decarboxylase n=1 Tax=Mangrovihabitans endophyticus TaxID=1751298 RepID=A0A8J3C6N5_9ACTN|nr:orotidine-5'-phosphate decarboxylase [Mangrovihabitans endophyticus]GGL13387.1 orotidine 5'-phosphate decarboxylase [Mangrovihabitans endophyticus]
METFGTRLSEAVAARGPLCVGIDPHAALLTRWGLSDDVTGLERFARTVVDALADRVAVLKPQSAFFERFGSRGIAVLESIIRQSREAGALVLLDVKRGDIGSTMAAYASAYLDPASPLRADAITVSPYLGVGSLRPAFDAAAAHGAGVFVLALTSNPEGPAVQHAVTSGGRTVGQTVIDEISQLNAGAEPLGSLGLVVGATIGETCHDLSKVNGPLLAPGLGAQGGTPEKLRMIFGEGLRNVLPSYSREVLGAGPDQAGLRSAAARAADACRAVGL